MTKELFPKRKHVKRKSLKIKLNYGGIQFLFPDDLFPLA